uniref:Integrator complex subunit 1 n=3 Tax=Cacopsylla melanoneura TaxID=428564 RepID=A0A8D8YUP5_9HEMI
MDRSKLNQGRGGKSKTPQFPSDIFALGAKTGRNESGDPKRNVPNMLGSKHSGPVPTSKLGTLGDRKRDLARIEPSTSSSVMPIKKPKISSPTIGDYWDSLAIDVDPVDLVPTVIDANNHDNSDKVIGILCGALKLLKAQQPRPDSILWMSLMHLATLHPYLFTHDCITQGLCSLLKKDAYKNKTASSTVLAANLLFEAYKDTKRWPDVFVKLYIEDAANERVWVDHELCHEFVENILTCVNTKPLTNVETLEDSIVDAVAATYRRSTPNVNVINRYSYSQEHIESLVLETVKEHLNRRQALDTVTKNILKLLTSTCGIPEIRLLVIPKLDAWLQNAKLMKPAQDLLMSLCINTTSHTQRDVEVISGLVKIRFKPKVLGGFYVTCIRELIAAHDENLSTVLKHTIYNELSASRNPNNIQVLSVMFQMEPEKTAQVLADNVVELLLNRDDYHRPLRLFLREISRAAKTDLDLNLLAKGLMVRNELPRDFEFKDRMFAALVDLIGMSCFLSVAIYVRGDLRIPDKVQRSVAQIQSDAVTWLHDHVLRVFRVTPQEYIAALYKITFKDVTSDTYFKFDMWPPDTEKQKFLQLVTEVPLLQSTLCRILMIGLSKEHFLSCMDAIELVDHLVRRAAVLPPSDSNPMLHADNLKIIDLLFNLSTYHHPENIDLPPGFQPPHLAIANMYWKTWLILLIYCAHNPVTFGTYCWDKFPTLRTLIEMSITNNFNAVQIVEDLQLLAIEKQSIIEFEAHLAAATSKIPITEQTSLLLSQLISLDPKGPVRRPPQVVIDQLKAEVPKLHLRRLLYRSRNPDFLLDIIKRQEPSQSMSWLADLVHSSEGSLNHLPVQCLCGFLLSSSSKQDGGKYEQLLRHLQSLLHESDASPAIVQDILSYFFHRLGFPENKAQAVAGLKLLLNRDKQIGTRCSDDEEEEDDKMEGIEKCVPLETDWLLVQLPKIPHFAHARAKVMVALRQACQVENDPHLVITYLVFLSKFGIVGADIAELTELVQDVANLIVERSTIMTAILPSYSDVSYLDKNVALDSMLNIFYTYFNMVRQPERESFVWSESQDQILVQWPSGEQCTCNILVVHAMVILLSHGPQSYVQQYHHLLDVWFPLDHTQAPRAFLVDTSEEALLIPDWLKLRMIRSKVPRLVDAALEDLEPTQLLLFIQSFGIPIGSMSKLLETLDLSVSEDKSTVENAVMDKAYMVQLVEVQHQRGATGGKVFANIIGQDIIASPERQDSPSPTPLSLSVTDITGDVEMKSVCDSKEDHSQITPSQIIKLLTSPDMLLALLKRLCEELSATKTKNESTPFIKQVLFELMTHSMSKQQCFHLVDGMLRNMNNATMILRMLTASSVRDVVASLSMSVKNIKDNLIKAHKVLSSPLLLIIDDFFKRNKQVLNRKKKGVKSQMKGELLDWLVQIEPEPISLTYSPSKEAMICRMFSQEGKNCPYILTLLIHHASWTTLHQCVQILLTRLSVESCNPRTVLDFLQALNSNPKFWQGREKNVPKHKENTYDDVLSLTHEQVICVIEYIVKEGELYGVDRIRSRINLCHNITPPVLEYLVRNKHKAYSSLVQKHLYIEFYLRFPSFLSCVGEIAGGTDMIVHMNNTGTTVLDKMSHTIITGLTCVELPRTKNHQLESALRKLASKHPILVLRQLPLIANSLLGIVYLESNVLRNRNYLNLFQQILRLLQLFEPHIFNKVYKESLQYIIDTYTQLFLQHGYMQEVSAMLPKFISFIQNYVSNDAETVNIYIQDNLDKLQAIQSQHPMIGVLINGVHDGEGAGGGGGGYPSETPNIPHDLIIEQLNGPDPSQALQELERFSSCPGVLERLFPSLVSLLSHESSTVRVTALSLLVSYVRHNPACVSSLVPSLLNTLNAATSPDVVASLCERLPDLIVFAQEDALPILSKLFSLNMWMNYNTIPSIMRCISTLSLQSGC